MSDFLFLWASLLGGFALAFGIAAVLVALIDRFGLWLVISVFLVAYTGLSAWLVVSL